MHRSADAADIALGGVFSQALIDAVAVAEEGLAEAIAEQAAPEPAAAAAVVDAMDMDVASHEAAQPESEAS